VPTISPVNAGWARRQGALIQNIENDPMQSKNGAAGMDARSSKNILTRRANQRYIAIV
jgi:hypothetical protein